MGLPECKNIFDFDLICRLCLKEKEVLEDLTTIHITVGQNCIKVLDLLNNVIDSPLNVEEESYKICSQCLDVASEVFQFKLQCESSISLVEEYRNNAFVTEEIIIEPIQDDDVDSNDSNWLVKDIDCASEDADVSNVVQVKRKIPKRGKYKRKKSTNDKVIVPTSLTCGLCSKSFTNKYTLKYHLIRHLRREPYTCNICGKSFYSKGSLSKHLTIHGAKAYKCDDCGREFSTANNLRMHKLIHSSQRPYLCTFCGKAFRQPTSLSYHMRTHTQYRPYACEFCGRRFALYGNYSTHKLLHTGERPFSCEVCGKGFVKKYDMKRHFSLIHSDKKDFLCIVCGKQFACEIYHRQHMMKHTQEFPHVCSICNKGFSRGYTFLMHKKTCTVERFEEKQNIKREKETRQQLEKDRRLDCEIKKVEKEIAKAKITNNIPRKKVVTKKMLAIERVCPDKNKVVRITRIKQKRIVLKCKNN